MPRIPSRYRWLLGWTIVSCLIAGVYGAVHDQLSFSLSPDYFFAFKFEQFRIATIWPPRVGAAIVGWMASWWTGLLVGPSLFLSGTRAAGESPSVETMSRALGITLATMMTCGGLALAIGRLLPIDESWRVGLPPGVTDVGAFVRVGMLHDASYLGGVLGTLAGVVFVVRAGRRKRSSVTSAAAPSR
jgi:hypothetical protein